MDELEKVVKELKELGYTDEKLSELFTLVLDEIQDQMLLDLAGASTDDELEAFKKKIENVRSKTEVDEVTTEMAKRVYGDKYKEKIEAMTIKQLKDTVELTRNIRNTYHRYAAGDPDTRKKVEEFEKSDEYKDLMKQMEDAGFDFLAEAAK